MKIFVTRHGETDGNALRQVCGKRDVSINSNGEKQALLLGNKLKNQGIDLIISSPMIRTIMTSEIIAKEINAKIITDNRLIEQDYGDYEGVSWDNPDFLRVKSQFAFKYPNGESMFMTAQRVYNFLDEIREKYKENKILIVTHGGICRILHTYFYDFTNEEFFHSLTDNCQLLEYDFN